MAPGLTVLGRVVAKTLEFAEREGMDRRALALGAELDGVDLDQPNVRVPFSAQLRLWQMIRTQSTDRAFGIKLGASVRARELGLLGYAMYYSGTLGGALRRLVRYGDLFNEAVRFRFARRSVDDVIVVECPLGFRSIMREALDSRIASLVSVAREITGTEVVPESVAFVSPRPGSTIDYSAFFRCPITFGARVTKIAFRPRDLALPVPRADEQVAGYLCDHAETQLRTLTSGRTATDSIRAVIWSSLSEGRPTLAATAASLGLSARTLQRQLADEGTSFKEELEEVRSQMALAALRDGSVPIDDVAFLLGYAEPSSFYRSFRRWTGRTPHQHRRAATFKRAGSAARPQ